LVAGGESCRSLYHAPGQVEFAQSLWVFRSFRVFCISNHQRKILAVEARTWRTRQGFSTGPRTTIGEAHPHFREHLAGRIGYMCSLLSESLQEHLPTTIAGVLRLRAIKPSVRDRSAKRFAQDDGFVGGWKYMESINTEKGRRLRAIFDQIAWA
jgi:hypothetical protein